MGIYILQKVAIAKAMTALRPSPVPAVAANESGYRFSPKEGTVLTMEQRGCFHPRYAVALGVSRYARYAFCKKCELQFYFENRTDADAGRQVILKKQLGKETRQKLEQARRRAVFYSEASLRSIPCLATFASPQSRSGRRCGRPSRTRSSARPRSTTSWTRRRRSAAACPWSRARSATPGSTE